MANIILRIAYDGTNYLGWQKTDQDVTHPSIEYTLQTTLERILQHPVSINAASRTDRGVHAEEQVANFITPKEALDLAKLQHSLNALLPPDIRILSVVEALDPDFHATLSSKAKQYLYRIYTGPQLLPFLRWNHWHIPEALDEEKMLLGADILLGEHDFSALRNHRKGKDYNDPVRTLFRIDIERPEPNLWHFQVTGNNFLYKMARNVVGTLVYVGLSKISPGSLDRILTSTKRANAGITAPAQGLTLYKVFYDFVSSPPHNI